MLIRYTSAQKKCWHTQTAWKDALSAHQRTVAPGKTINFFKPALLLQQKNRQKWRDKTPPQRPNPQESLRAAAQFGLNQKLGFKFRPQLIFKWKKLVRGR